MPIFHSKINYAKRSRAHSPSNNNVHFFVLEHHHPSPPHIYISVRAPRAHDRAANFQACTLRARGFCAMCVRCDTRARLLFVRVEQHSDRTDYCYFHHGCMTGWSEYKSLWFFLPRAWMIVCACQGVQ